MHLCLRQQGLRFSVYGEIQRQYFQYFAVLTHDFVLIPIDCKSISLCIFSGEVRRVQLCVRHLRVLHCGELNLHLNNNNSNNNNNNYNNHNVLKLPDRRGHVSGPLDHPGRVLPRPDLRRHPAHRWILH